MFNFLGDSLSNMSDSLSNMGERLVNYAAPVQSQTQQYHLAIQHHRNDEARHFIQSGQIRIGNIEDTGFADIHVACRFNNRLILELVISQGVDINLLDKVRNTPLHFASKFGNIDICRYLVSLNCLTGCRNVSGQSPYDVAESHIVRQFLLPLQFKEEANHPDAIAQQQQPQDPFAIGGRSQVPTNVAPPPVLSPPHGGGGDLSANSPQFNNYYQQQQQYSIQSRYVAYPGMESNSNMQNNTSGAPQQYMNQAPVPYTQSQGPTKSHIIQPDGFGSSQTDVKLQQKYGNVKEKTYISPPPIGGISNTPAPTPPHQDMQPGMTRSTSTPEAASAPLPTPSTLPIPSTSSSGRKSAPTSGSGKGGFAPPAVKVNTNTMSMQATLPTPSTVPSSVKPRSPAASLPVSSISPSSTSSIPSTSSSTVSQTTVPLAPPAPPATTFKPPTPFASSSIIKPDGFGSSQTDVKLQQKYGNVKEQVYISPPPTGGFSVTPTVSLQSGAPSQYTAQQQSFQSFAAPPAMYQQKPMQQQQKPSAHFQPQPQASPPLPFPTANAKSPSRAPHVPPSVSSSTDMSSTFSTIDLNSSSSRGSSHSSGDFIDATSTSSAMM